MKKHSEESFLLEIQIKIPARQRAVETFDDLLISSESLVHCIYRWTCFALVCNKEKQSKIIIRKRFLLMSLKSFRRYTKQYIRLNININSSSDYHHFSKQRVAKRLKKKNQSPTCEVFIALIPLLWIPHVFMNISFTNNWGFNWMCCQQKEIRNEIR